MGIQRRLLWVDGLAGLFVGLVTLLLIGWLPGFYGLPQSVVLFIGGANLVYGSYSISLAFRSVRPQRLIVLLAALNLCWTVVCVVLVILYGETATFFGLAHIIAEGFFVGALAWLEWKWRELLVKA
ncbi:MAG: hypothetical protein AB8G77_03945 [Rhodothermales bacterium]